MKISILGAGAMGSLYATFLADQGDVTLLDSYQPQVDAINANGITRREPDGSEYCIKNVKAAASGTDIGVQDVVIVFVKSICTYSAVEENKALIGADTIVLTLQNGAGNNRDIAAFASPEQIVVGTSSHNCVALEPGHISHSGNGPTNIGPDVPGKRGDAACKTLETLLAASGLEVHIIENIQEVLWSKIFVNCGVNPISALFDCTCGEVANNPYLWKIACHIIDECVLVAEADGTYFDRRAVKENVKKVLLANRGGLPSMCQDRQHCRRTEIDKLNGTVAKLGGEYGIDTPYNRMITDLIHAAEAQYPKK